LGKKKEIIKRSERYHKLRETFYLKQSKCFKNGIFISAENVTNFQKWRISVEFRDPEGRLKSIKNSDPTFYYSKAEYEEKIMELNFFYADKV